MPTWLTRFEEHIAVPAGGGPLSAEQIARVPARRGVVALLATGDRPIALMTAADMRARVRTRLREPAPGGRRRSADLRAITRRLAWVPTWSHFETDLRFFELARRIWPEKFPAMLAWKPACFVHVDPAGALPHFSAGRRLPEEGRSFGPFPSDRAARAFIDALQDAFALCRDLRCLRDAPHAVPCAYGQMGRCLLACNGTVSMDEYRRAVAQAAEFAAGRRDPLRRELTAEMRASAERLDFERAAAVKARLARLAALGLRDFAHVRPLEAFQFVLVQPGPSRTRARAFLVDRGRLAEPRSLSYPLRPAELRRTLRRMAEFAGAAGPTGEPERWRTGLVAQALFSGPRRRGLALHWTPDLDAGAFASAIESARGVLMLRAPRRPRAR